MRKIKFWDRPSFDLKKSGFGNREVSPNIKGLCGIENFKFFSIKTALQHFHLQRHLENRTQAQIMKIFTFTFQNKIEIEHLHQSTRIKNDGPVNTKQ